MKPSEERHRKGVEVDFRNFDAGQTVAIPLAPSPAIRKRLVSLVLRSMVAEVLQGRGRVEQPQVALAERHIAHTFEARFPLLIATALLRRRRVRPEVALASHAAEQGGAGRPRKEGPRPFTGEPSDDGEKVVAGAKPEREVVVRDAFGSDFFSPDEAEEAGATRLVPRQGIEGRFRRCSGVWGSREGEAEAILVVKAEEERAKACGGLSGEAMNGTAADAAQVFRLRHEPESRGGVVDHDTEVRTESNSMLDGYGGLTPAGGSGILHFSCDNLHLSEREGGALAGVPLSTFSQSLVVDFLSFWGLWGVVSEPEGARRKAVYQTPRRESRGFMEL